MAVAKKGTTVADQLEDSGQGLRLSLQCPKCHDIGIVEWKSLQSSFRCHKCNCQFLIDKHGKVLDQAKLPKIRFACPRCHQSGSIPAMLAVRGVECIGCRLPLAPGPDRKLYGVQEAAQLRRQLHQGEQHGLRARMRGQFINQQGDLQWSRVAICVVAAVAILTGTAMLLSMRGDPAERAARRFTYACLAGDWNAAEAEMAEDDVQLAEFRRWRTRHYASILDKHRPSGDRVSVELVDTAASNGPSDARSFQVTLTSPHLGSRRHDQVWQLHDDTWQFDAAATLAKTDQIPVDPLGADVDH